MSIKWKDDINTYSYDEGTSLDIPIFYESYQSDDSVKIEASVISNTLPSSINVSHYSENNKFHIKGILPIINESCSYYLVLRILEQKNNEIIEIIDRCIEIKSINKELKWINDSDNIIYNITEYSNININLLTLLENTNGDEIVKKTSGTLPDGIKLENNVLFGSFMKESNDQNTYKITVKVFRNNVPIDNLVEKDIILEIYPPSQETLPEWITNEGNIGTIKFGEESKLYILAYDPSNNYTIMYNIVNGILPQGLSFDIYTGKIQGILKTKQSKEWNITVEASKIVNDSTYSTKRTFSIKTNNINEYNEIVWNDNDFIGSYKVGSIITTQIPFAHTQDNNEIEYNVIGGDLPKGLILDKNGIISGKIKYQKYGKYFFDVVAKTPITSQIKTFSINVEKGLGKNSIKMYLRFNNEYRNQLNHIKSYFNSKIFNNGSSNFYIDTFPKIDIATLTCYDRELLSYMLNFGNPEIVRLGKTKKIQHSQPDRNGNIISNYDIFYKSIDESTLQWDKINNGNYNFYQDLDDDEKLDFNFETYDSNSNENDNETDPHVKYNVFNFENVRKILSQKIYVYKKTDGYYFYDTGSHEILGKSLGVDDKTFTPDYNHMEVVYDEGGDLIVENASVVEDSKGDVVLKDTYEYGETIYNPWCFDRNKNDIQLVRLTEDSEFVIPLISDDDVKYDDAGNSYIQFLDVDVEPLPEWKINEIENWTPNTQYHTNDIVKYNYKYYKCKQDFTSSDTFTDDGNLYEILTIDGLYQYINKSYFPTLDIGYYEVDSNTSNLKLINSLEDRGDLLTNYDFTFYEVTCEHLYHESIVNDNLEEYDYNSYKCEEIKNHNSIFGIPFYSMSYMDYGHSDLVKTLSINAYPKTSTISIQPLSDENNKNATTVPYGTTVSYSVTHPKYFGVSDTFKLLMDEEIDIKLKKKVRFILKTEPFADEIILKTSDNSEYFDYIETDESGEEKVVGKYIDVKEGDIIEYSISKDKYVSIIDNVVATGIIEKDDFYEQKLIVSLTPLYTLTIIPTPSDSDVSLKCNGYYQSGNSITVPKDSYIYYTVSKEGYKTISGRHRATRDEQLPISLLNNAFTVSINVSTFPISNNEPSVIITSNRPLGQQIDNSLIVAGDDGEILTEISYTVSLNGYETVSNTITGVSENKVINVALKKICHVKFEITPSDAEHVIKYNGLINSSDLEFDVLYGDVISYEISRVCYESIVAQKIIQDDTIIEINMIDKEYFVLETNDTIYFANERSNIAFTKE